MKVTFAHLCDYATISREGKLSVIGIFHNLGALKFPVTHPLLFVVFEMEISVAEVGTDVQCTIQLRRQDGQKIGEATAKPFRVVPQQGGGLSVRIPQIVPLPGIAFPVADTYCFHVLVNGREEARVAFEVITVEQAPPKA